MQDAGTQQQLGKEGQIFAEGHVLTDIYAVGMSNI
jgi:hypothetical protein